MEIRNLTTFLKVAALRNFTRAARELGYSQSNVSAQILQLEREVGAPLFDRIGKQVRLTQFGEELLPYARELCSTAAKMENMLRSEDFLGGTVHLGMTDSLAELSLESSFLAYHRRFPRVRLEITLDTSARLLERLRSGELDAACIITNPLLHAEWLIWEELQSPIVVVANPALPIASKGSVSLAELTEQKLIMMERDAPYCLAFEETLAQYHLSIDPVFRHQSTATACRLASQGPFVSVLPLYAVKSYLDRGLLRILEVPQWKHRQTVPFVLHRSRTLTPQIEGILKELHKTMLAAGLEPNA